MDEINHDGALSAPIFSAELTPHRSLGRRGFRVLLALSAVLFLGQAGFFLYHGAWPVGAFFGFDFLLLYGAFRLNYRAARAREEISVSRTDLSVRKYAPSGRMTEHRFATFFARFLVRRHEEFGILSMHVTGEGRGTDIGSFLNPDDRETFARAFKGALATAKRRI